MIVARSSGVARALRRSISASPTPRPSWVSSRMAPSSIISTRPRSGSWSRTESVRVACAWDSTMARRTPASDRIHCTWSADEVQWILSDAGVRLAIVESQAHATLTESVRDQLPDLGRVLMIDDGAIQELTHEGRGVGDAEIERRSALATPDDLATIIYTSGTTGRPKGAELTHRNFVMLSLEGQRGLYDVCAAPGSRTLLFMPLAHVFARFIEVLCLATGAVIGHTPDTKNLLADLGTFKPTFILSVPRVFEKVYNSSEQKAGGGTKLKLFRWAAKTSIVYSRALDTTEGPNAALKAQHALADRLVLHKLRNALGGQAKYAISGGAPLGERLGHFYRGLGLRVLEGYGLTETTAPAAVGRAESFRIGTVGPPMPGSISGSRVT